MAVGWSIHAVCIMILEVLLRYHCLAYWGVALLEREVASWKEPGKSTPNALTHMRILFSIDSAVDSPLTMYAYMPLTISGVARGGAMGAVRPGRHFLGAAKLRLYLKIWERKKYIEGEKF